MRVKLCRGKGKEGQSHCVMAATSMLNDEKFTDRPVCVDTVITELLIVLNDTAYMSKGPELYPASTFQFHPKKGFVATTTNTLVNTGHDCPDERDQELGHLPWVIIGTRGGFRVTLQRYSAVMDYMFPALKSEGTLWNVVDDTTLANLLWPHRNEMATTAVSTLAEARKRTSALVCDMRTSLNFAASIYLIDIQCRLSPEDYKQKRRELIAFVENVLVPMYTEAPKEESYADRVCKLHLQEQPVE